MCIFVEYKLPVAKGSNNFFGHFTQTNLSCSANYHEINIPIVRIGLFGSSQYLY